MKEHSVSGSARLAEELKEVKKDFSNASPDISLKNHLEQLNSRI